MDEFEAAGRLFDRQIEDSSGALVGRVEDLVVDLTSGQIEYVLIALPRQDSAECETVTVPWSLIVTNTRTRSRWRVGVDKTVLERAVSERRRRHRADSRRLARRVRRYQFED
jgi:sporulation protein YlmC with PRC-barrel domain